MHACAGPLSLGAVVLPYPDMAWPADCAERLFCTVGCHPTRCGEFEAYPDGPDAYLAALREVGGHQAPGAAVQLPPGQEPMQHLRLDAVLRACQPLSAPVTVMACPESMCSAIAHLSAT